MNNSHNILISAFIANINSNCLGWLKKKRVAKLSLFGTKSERKGCIVVLKCFHASKILLYKYFFSWTRNRFRHFFFPTSFKLISCESGLGVFSFYDALYKYCVLDFGMITVFQRNKINLFL